MSHADSMMSSIRFSATVPKAPYVLANRSLSNDPFMSCFLAMRLRITGMLSFIMSSMNMVLITVRVIGEAAADNSVVIELRYVCVCVVPIATARKR
jgi:hypothetical protein